MAYATINKPEGHFDEKDNWIDVNSSSQTSKGQRPIVAFIGGNGDHAAVKFISGKSDNDSLLGATISIGGNAPVSAMVHAMTVAASGVITSLNVDAVAVEAALFDGANCCNDVCYGDKLIAWTVETISHHHRWSGVVASWASNNKKASE